MKAELARLFSVQQRTPIIVIAIGVVFFIYGLAAGAAVAPSAMAALLLVGSTLPIIAAVGIGRTARNIPFIMGLMAVGLVGLGVVTTLARLGGVSPGGMIAIYMAIGLVAFFASAVYAPPATVRQGGTHHRLEVAGIVLSLILTSVLLVYSFRMGAGVVPAAFYGVDNSYHLGIVHMLTTEDIYPPRSLTFVGQMGAYHYATLDGVAMLARYSGLPTHTAMFLFGGSVLALGTAGLCWAIARHLSDGWLALPIAAMLYFATYFHYSMRFVRRVFKSIYWLASGKTDEALPLTIHPGHLITQAGILMVLFCLYLILTRRDLFGRFLAGAVAATSVLIKAQYFVTLCIWLACVGGLEFLQGRPWRASLADATRLALRHSLYLLFAALLGWILLRIGSFDNTGRELRIALLADSYAAKNIVQTFRSAWIYFVPGVLALAFARGRGLNFIALLGIALALAPLSAVAVTSLGTPGSTETDFNWFQIALPSTLGFALCASAILAGAWPHVGRIGRPIVALAIVAAVGTQILRQPLMAIDTALHPSHGEEAVDNTDIIPALRAIPVPGSLLVTNDLRSPAEDYKRPDRQPQIPAIYGHQGFLITPAYDNYLPEVKDKKAAQELLRLEKWDPRIAEAARRYGWTHFLVHKLAPYPKDLPLQKLYDSDRYAVYRF